MPERERTLTDADVEAISDRVLEKFRDGMYRDLGKGLWGILQKAVVGAVLFLYAWSQFKGWSK